MTALLLLSLLLFAAGIVTGLIALVKRIRRKPAKKSGIICAVCFAAMVLCFFLYIGLTGDFSTMLTMLALLALIAVPVLLIIALIRALCHKSGAKKLCIAALLLFLFVFAAFGYSSSTDLPTLLLLLGLLLAAAVAVLLLANLILRLAKKPHKKLRIANLVCLVLCVGLFISYNLISDAEREKLRSGGELETIDPTVTSLDFAVEDGTEPLGIMTSDGFEDGGSQYYTFRKVFDCSEDSLLLSVTNVTPEMCIEAIEKSETIDENRKELFCGFVRRIGEIYPDADLAILYHNLSSLKVEDVNSWEMLSHTWDSSAYACYVMPENTIYLPEGVEYVEGTWDYQVVIHEFCHACRTSWFEDGELKCRMQFDSDSDNDLLDESMNSVFSCSLLDYYEPDIAYQMPSNYLRIMVECMDYDLTDYMNHSDCYFLHELDEYAGYTNYAQVIWKLVTLQRTDWEEDSIDIDAASYEPIYDFLCELYYGKYLTDDMTDEEALALAQELSEKAGCDCPEGYKFEADYFTEYMENLLAERNAE